MRQARRHWPFITHFDASTIRNGTPLVTRVKDRSGGTRQAEFDVEAWMVGRQF
ncbi:MAG: hypothetical protein ACXWUX_12130 [Allosphingosinicella sp.]